MIDLGAWAEERYKIPGGEIDTDIDDEEDGGKKIQ